MKKIGFIFLLFFTLSFGNVHSLDVEGVTDFLQSTINEANEAMGLLDELPDEVRNQLEGSLLNTLGQALENLQIVMEVSHYLGSFTGGGRDAIDEYEFTNEKLQQAEKTGRLLGDIVADIIIWASR